ncbi:TPA: hypothetical protein N0F65_006819 [Lagenidium giganteum]|uniref:Uncharacterized protein n=1 Tax=Lagenidium giganteum TaxID=4803 RepID=A0AAV2ZCD4_9STRA|nr:TPA: hypothetical protein N0F65_006819 [Lagenidium giganteum]
MYSSKQCALRSGLLYIELPFALLILVVMAVAGVRITATALESLRFPESPKDDFAFPRSFQQTQRSLGVLTPYIGTWKGPMQRNLPWHKQHILTKLLLVVIVPLELLPYIQIAAINFLPIFPWPSTSFLTQAFRYSLLYPFWRHSTAELYPVYWFSGAAGFVFGALILVVLLGWQNFPLFKPQPAKSPVENPCTLVLRLYSDWAVIPVMISQLLPFECFLTGYNKAETFLFVLPVVRDQCFTWITLGHMSLGLAAMISYSFISSAIALQLNSESTEPIPVLWTDPVYVRVVQTVRMTLAMVKQCWV